MQIINILRINFFFAEIIFVYWPIGFISVVVSKLFAYTDTIIYSGLLALIIDQVLLAESADNNLIQLYLFGLFAYYFFLALANAFGNYSRSYFRNTIGIHIREMLVRKQNKLPLSEIESPEYSNLKQRADRSIELIVGQFFDITSFVGMLVGLISLMAVVFTINPLFILLAFITVLPKTITSILKSKRIFNFVFDNTEDSRVLYTSLNYLGSRYNTIGVRFSVAYSMLMSIISKKFDYYFGGRYKIEKKYDAIYFITTLIAKLGFLIVLLFLTTDALNGLITLGLFTFYVSTTNSLFNNISSLITTISTLYDRQLKLQEIYELLNMEEQSMGNKEIDLSVSPQIEFDKVWFRYKGAKRYIYKDLSFKIKAGENLALVGKNGAGKTTLIKLITGVYNPTKGNIFVNGVNLKEVKKTDWYKLVGYMGQEFNTYPMLSVKDNIFVSKSVENEDEAIAAARDAEVFDFVFKYENGFDTVLDESFTGGIRPSTGQWQKIAIASIFYKNPSLILFDEPTSAIDAVAESRIFTKIYDFFRKKTVVIVSHRFSTVRNADRILVIEEGKIIEEGSHNSLVNLDGYYAEAFKMQAEGYN